MIVTLRCPRLVRIKECKVVEVAEEVVDSNAAWMPCEFESAGPLRLAHPDVTTGSAQGNSFGQ